MWIQEVFNFNVRFQVLTALRVMSCDKIRSLWIASKVPESVAQAIRMPTRPCLRVRICLNPVTQVSCSLPRAPFFDLSFFGLFYIQACLIGVDLLADVVECKPVFAEPFTLQI